MPDRQQSQEPSLKLGKWGNMHRRSLAENRPEEARSLSPEAMRQRCQDVNADAESLYQRLLKQGSTPEQAEEFVTRERVLVPDAETAKAMRDGYVD